MYTNASYQYQYTCHYPSTSILTTTIHALVNILFTFHSDKNEKHETDFTKTV